MLSAATTGQTVLSLSYNFHAGNFDNGNIYQIANNRDTTRTQSFTYDNLNRLTQASSSGTKWGEAFTADPWGNMWQRSPVSGKTNYEALNAPASLQNQLTGFSYDVAGNMIQNGSATYTYDGDNRLTATAGWTYVYDGDGVRVEKKNGSTGTLYWTGTGSAAISESDLAGTDKEEYVFFGAERIARRDVATNTVHYYFSDHLGSASVVTNASGAIEDESDYYPYGGEMVIAATAPQNYKFTGKERDAESGLDDFGARFHASALGRFMTPDWDAKPMTVPYAKFGDPQTLNLYSYVENAPVNRADADGHEEYHPVTCDSSGPCASDKELGDQTIALKAKDAAFGVTPGLKYVTLTTTSTTSTTDDKGVTTTTTTTSTAFFAAQGDNAGKYSGTATRTETVRSDDPKNPSSKTTFAQQDSKGLSATFGGRNVASAQQGAGAYASTGPASIGFFKPSLRDVKNFVVGLALGACLVGEPCGAFAAGAGLTEGAYELHESIKDPTH